MVSFNIFRWRRRGQLEREGPSTKGKRHATRGPEHNGRPASVGMVPILVIFLVWAACGFSILYHTPRGSYDFVPGQKAPENVFALTEFEYVALAATEADRQKAEDSAPRVWRLDSAAAAAARARFKRLFTAIADNSAPPTMPPGADKNDAAALLADISPESWQVLRDLFDSEDKPRFFLTRLDAVMLTGVVSHEDRALRPQAGSLIRIIDDKKREQTVDLADRPGPLEVAKTVMDDFHRSFPGARPRAFDEVTRDVIARLILPNLQYDLELSQLAKSEAMGNTPPIMARVAAGNAFITEGTLITAQEMEKLRSHNLAVEEGRSASRYRLLEQAKLLALSLVLIICGAIYLGQVAPKVTRVNASVILVGLALALNVLLLWGIYETAAQFQGFSRALLFAALPLGFTAILISLLLGVRMGITLGIFTAFLGTLHADSPIHVLVLGVVSAVAGALAVRSVRTRVQTFRAVAYLGLAIFLVEVVFLLVTETPWPYYPKVLGIALANALASTILVNLLLPLCETCFGITTNITLLELGDLNHPILRRLQTEANGTYHHTLNVATLAEHAAEAVGANTLLARVASYFHDIGKLSNPSYFTENSGGIDRHRELSPRMSSLIILNHVKEGLAMARKLKLRRPIVEAIATHHGNSLVYFFYRRALDDNMVAPNGQGEGDYRYPGPLPMSKEAAIISIADACEAAARSVEKPTPGKIDTLVTDLVNERLRDGQLDGCELSINEIRTVAASIKQALTNMHHGRVAYPTRESEPEGPHNEGHKHQGNGKAGTPAAPSGDEAAEEEHADSPGEQAETLPADESPPAAEGAPAGDSVQRPAAPLAPTR